ncbi:molybdopterin-dependent oxidoreductase [Fodinisporobacter ferrooxydans]|uniref:Molybdopterin-dependent oxidoreductase n=1 Tax=Fodinisporobacter ferrooxydans TaxID=2901836 RepID=A0ABY4CN77_9BACL|nr:molybdopterin-dependent oxidoreductase [Alicyclobacillaceae bacterium MYW30-H2]
MKHIRTACPLDCWDACGMVATVDEHGRIRHIEGDPEHPITQGMICGKGRKLVDRLYHKERILTPLKKINGRFHEISWQLALDEIAEYMSNFRSSYGPTSILHHYDYGSGTLLKTMETRFFNLFGGFTDTIGSLCWGAGLEAQRFDFGYSASHSPDDMAEHSGHIVIWGRNVNVTNMHMMPFIKRAMARGVPITVINPSPTDFDRFVANRFHPRPGTDGALAFGVCKQLIDLNLADEMFIKNRTVGFQQFHDSLQSFSLDRVSEMTGISSEQIMQLAAIYGDAKPTCTLLGIGLQRYSNGGNTIRAIDALAAISGNIGISGAGVNYANRGISKFFDWDAFTALDKRYAYREFTKITQADEIIQAQNPPIQMLFVTRANPITQIPDANKTIRAYQSIPVKVVIDMFMTETAKLADYILPCLHALEEEDVLFSTMWSPYMVYMNPVISRIGDTKPDLEIWQELANRLGFGAEMAGSPKEWIDRAFGKLKEYGISSERLQKAGYLRFPIPEVPWKEGEFATPSGKYEFLSSLAGEESGALPVYLENQDERYRNRYPFHLLTVHPRKSLNSQGYTINGQIELPQIEISKAIAMQRSVTTGDRILIWNDRGSLVGRVKVSSGLQEQTIKIEQGFSTKEGKSVNILTANYLSDLGIGSAQYDCRINLKKI